MRSVGKTDYPNKANSSMASNKRSGDGSRGRSIASFIRQDDKSHDAEFLGVTASRAERIWKRLFYGLFAAAFTYGIITGGHLSYSVGVVTDKIDAFVRDAGFAISNVEIAGQDRVSDQDIIDVLQVDKVSLLRFNTRDARERVEDLEWVDSARVMRFFPATVKVVIEERQPYALWQTRGQFFLVDTKGVVIKEQKQLTSEYQKLTPLIVGDGADTAVRLLFGELRKHHPRLMLKLKAAVRVAKRRWTLRLNNGVEILLPEKNLTGALAELHSLEKRYRVLSGAISRIDMRLPDRITLRRLEKKGAPGAALKEQKSYSHVHIRRSGA